MKNSLLNAFKSKKQKQIFFLFVCSIVIALSLFLKSNIDSMNKKYGELYIDFIEEDKNYEIGSSLKAISFIEDTNADDIEYPMIDTSQVGEKSFFYIAYDSAGNQKEFILKLNFIDAINPIIELSQNEIEVSEGDTIDLDSFVKRSYDPIEGDLPYTIEKPTDYLKVGTHEIKYRCIDKNQNKTEVKLVITVKEKEQNEEIPQIEPQAPQEQPIAPEAPQNPSIPEAPNIPKPVEKYYMFSDGYNMQTAPSICQSDLAASGAGGSCTQILGEDGWPIGMKLNIY